MNDRTVGTCSICGGRVTVPTVYMSVKPPRPCCESCGARAKQDFGPVVEMEPRATVGAKEWGRALLRNRWESDC
jgi:hypothetical protein